MAAKHMKLLLAALALLLALAATFAHAECETIPRCEKCSSPTRCDECKAGYSLAYEGGNVCTSFCRVVNCEKCSTSKWDTCDRCFPGYMLSDDLTRCFSVPCKISGCTHCATENICATCAKGFELSADGASCVPKSNYCFVPHCVWCNSKRYLNCEECSAGYELTDDKTLCSGAMTPAGAATSAIAAFALAAAALAL